MNTVLLQLLTGISYTVKVLQYITSAQSISSAILNYHQLGQVKCLTTLLNYLSHAGVYHSSTATQGTQLSLFASVQLCEHKLCMKFGFTRPDYWAIMGCALPSSPSPSSRGRVHLISVSGERYKNISLANRASSRSSSPLSRTKQMSRHSCNSHNKQCQYKNTGLNKSAIYILK